MHKNEALEQMLKLMTLLEMFEDITINKHANSLSME